MTVLKPRYSIQQLFDKWKLPESEIIHHIKDGLLPIYAESLVVTILPTEADEEWVEEHSVLSTDKKTVERNHEIVDAYNLKHMPSVPPFIKPATITLGGH